MGCSKDQLDLCRANVDCSGTEACVQGECIYDPNDCEVVGAFGKVTQIMPQNAKNIIEIHTVIDETGAVHYCYFGQSETGDHVAYWGRQTAWNTFVETAIIDEKGRSGDCGALVISSEGQPFILARNLHAVLFKTGQGAWSAAALEGLSGAEAKGALSSARVVISMSSDESGGVYLGMSLGFELYNQAVYLAHVTQGSLKLILNGWQESKEHTAVGYAPQWLPAVKDTDSPSLLIGYPKSNTISFADADLISLMSVEGLYHRLVVGAGGEAFVLYLGNNFQLRLDRVKNDELEAFASLGAVQMSQSADGQIPWAAAVDVNGATHLLIEDQSMGGQALLFKEVSKEGKTTEGRLVSDSLETELPGMQRYALGTDLCGRATIVIVESDQKTGGVSLRQIEGR